MDRQRQNLEISEDILNFLACRFIYNVPVEERSDIVKFFFNIEKAYWFFEDNFCTNVGLKYRLKPFAFCLFRHVPFLCYHLWNLDQILSEFNLYKKAMPRYGAILISTGMDKVLLVQSCWGNCTWTFPKGKAELGENSLICATREVYEETGFNITTVVQPELYIEASMRGQYTKLYIVKNVPETTIFTPRTKNEIRSCKWFDMNVLLNSTRDIISKPNVGITSNTFWMKQKLKSFLNDQCASKMMRENVGAMLMHLNESNRQRNVDSTLNEQCKSKIMKENLKAMLAHLNEANKQSNTDLIPNEQSPSNVVSKNVKTESFKCREDDRTVASQNTTVHDLSFCQIKNQKHKESKATTFLFDIIQISILFLIFILFFDLFVQRSPIC